MVFQNRGWAPYSKYIAWSAEKYSDGLYACIYVLGHTFPVFEPPIRRILYYIFGPDTRLSGSAMEVIIPLENHFCEVRTILQQSRKTLQGEN
jgi:hypothetical protein